MSTNLAALANALRTGHFLDAANLLKNTDRSVAEVITATLEVSYYLGHCEFVRKEGPAMVEARSLTESQRAKSAFILGCQLCDDGDAQAGMATFQRGLELSHEANDASLTAMLSSCLLDRLCDQGLAFDASLPLATQTRRTTARCGDPQITAAVHLAFGRLEGRAGHLETARRHFSIARGLLQTAPNIYLSALTEHGDSSVLALSGDIAAALRTSERAALLARESGWAKGIVAVAGNLGFLLDKLDRTDEAEKQLRIASNHPFKSPTYELAIAETRAAMAIRASQYDRAREILIDIEGQKDKAGVWFELAAKRTRAQLLLRQEKWAEALTCCEDAFKRAVAVKAEGHCTSLLLEKAEALIGLQRQEEVADLLLEWKPESSPISLLGSYWIVLARTFKQGGLDNRALRYLKRGIRVMEATGNKAAEIDAEALLDNYVAATAESDERSQIGPDEAASFLELVGNPHLLAREAMALLDETNCTNQLRLVATNQTGSRVVDARVRRGREQPPTGRRAELETINFGDHCGETWQIIAGPREELDYRCTFVAIRKLLAIAIELDGYRREQKQRKALWPAEALEPDSDSIWASEQMSEVLNIARRIAPTPLSILLTGETGTGKEMLARAIHRASDRADRTFLPFNCTAVPRDMLESQLFGYRKGAFTGADTSFQGIIRSAAGGTLFLDEIADVSLDVQPKLLRFLETHEIHPLGEPQPIKVDVRIVAATNANLEQLVADGRFREDLFYRLNVVRLKLPPLRERREEIPPLVQHYLRKFGDEQKKGQLTLADETLEYLLLYGWPGNVRQLANEVRRMAALAEPDSALTPSLLSPEIQASRRTIPAATTPAASAPEIRVRLDQPLPLAVEMLERTMIRSALSRSRGRVEEAAKLLGISRKGLFLKRRRWNLDQQQAS